VTVTPSRAPRLGDQQPVNRISPVGEQQYRSWPIQVPHASRADAK
jgi:hypothetical protein